MFYSSKTGKWKVPLKFSIKRTSFTRINIYLNGRFYWLNRIRHVITFWVGEELSGVITVLGPKMKNGGLRKASLGNFDWCLYYVCVDMSERRVWVLIDLCKSNWVLKHQLNLDQFRVESKRQFLLHKLFCSENIGHHLPLDTL